MHSQLPKSALFAILAAFAGIYVIWGTTYLAIAVAIRTLPPFISGGARFLIAGAVMYLWLRSRGPRPLAGVDLRIAALCGVLLTGIGNGFVVWGQQGIPSGIAALIVCAVPVLVLVFDWAFFSRRKPNRQALFGTAVAVAGVATIVMHTRTLTGGAQPLYILAILAATVGWSLGTLLQKRSARAETVLSFTCAQMLAGGLFQFGMAAVTNEYASFDLSAVSLESIIGVLYLIVFGSLIGLNCYLWLLTRVAAPKVTTYALVNPVVALLLGAVFLGEAVTPLAICAAVLVLVGVALVLFQDLSVFKLFGRRTSEEARKAAPLFSTCEIGVAMSALTRAASGNVPWPRVLRTFEDGLQITTFDPRHRDAFKRLNVAWLTKYFRVEPIDERVLGEPEREILEPGGEILFAMVDAEVAGTVALKAEQGSAAFELTKMAVDDPYKGRGYGSRLLEAACDLARNRGAERVILFSQRALERAVGMYFSHGFIELPNDEPRYARCDIKMERWLK